MVSAPGGTPIDLHCPLHPAEKLTRFSFSRVLKTVNMYSIILHSIYVSLEDGGV